MTTKINKLRIAMLEHPELFAGIRLSKREREVVMWVRTNNQPVMAGMTAVHIGSSLTQAHALLRGATEKGYLRRVLKHGVWRYAYALGRLSE